MYTLLIDNHDSFSYNILHLLQSIKDGCDVKIIATEDVTTTNLLHSRRIILSPGPGLPQESANLMQIINKAEKLCPLLGICLGHQALSIHFGASLTHLIHPYHGVQSVLSTTNCPLFRSLNKVVVTRYHSWAINEQTMPNNLEITSFSEDNCIMSFQHKRLPIWGVQFHPESFSTIGGKQMINNFFQL